MSQRNYLHFLSASPRVEATMHGADVCTNGATCDVGANQSESSIYSILPLIGLREQLLQPVIRKVGLQTKINAFLFLVKFKTFGCRDNFLIYSELYEIQIVLK